MEEDLLKGSFTLVIIRHAHRNKDQGSDADNGLSKRGISQSKKIKKYFKYRFGKASPIVFSSPKLRCVETVERIAKEYRTQVEIASLLDEGGNLEQKSSLFIEEIKNQKAPLICASSHGDLIPALTQKLIGYPIILSKGAWVEFEVIKGKFFLQWLFQDFDFL